MGICHCRPVEILIDGNQQEEKEDEKVFQPGYLCCIYCTGPAVQGKRILNQSDYAICNNFYRNCCNKHPEHLGHDIGHTIPEDFLDL